MQIAFFYGVRKKTIKVLNLPQLYLQSQASGGSRSSKMPVHEFKVEMTCSGCSGAVERVLGKLGDKVEKVSIDLDEKTVLVTSNLSADELLEVIKKTGKTTTYVGVKE
ncbi:copper transport protein ATOX1 [Teleopsis dalmanni]|uniref:copper transport protein ATOX1 n=1 Tax=Teleopsis dalmanni TaxID=139649 RepID=UPI0018CDAF4B|nr:copper transport protein ATOX1 [Teleopsis dalmanni]